MSTNSLTQYRAIVKALHPYISDPADLVTAATEVMVELAIIPDTRNLTRRVGGVPVTQADYEAIVEHVINGRLINAIKHLRQVTPSLSLRSAKTAVELLRDDLNARSHP